MEAIKIKPIKVFRKPDGTLLIISCNGFQIGADNANFTWDIYNKDLSTSVSQGVLNVAGKVFESWGTDDTQVIDYIMTTVGLERDLTQ